MFDGENRRVIVSTVSYTGWKLVGVLPDAMFAYGMINLRYFLVMMLILMAMMLVVLNRIVSVRISRPILKLNTSVLEYEAGKSRKFISAAPRKSVILDIPYKNRMSGSRT